MLAALLPDLARDVSVGDSVLLRFDVSGLWGSACGLPVILLWTL